jgi:translocation and assembly module TamB
LSLTIQSDAFAYNRWRGDGVNLDTDIDLSDRTASRLSLSAKQLAHGDYVFSQVVIDAQGNAASHEASLHGVLGSPIADNQQLTINLRGRYENESADKLDKSVHRQQWLGQVTRMDLKNSQLHAELDHAAEFAIERDLEHELTVALHGFCMHVDNGHACGSGEWRSEGPWQLQASINKWPLVLEHSANAEVTRLTTNIDATADIRRSSDQSLLGNARLTLSDAIIRYRLGDHEEVLPITQGSMQLNADARGITSSAALHIASDTVADFNATAKHTASTDIEDWPLQGKLALRSEDTKLIPVFIHEVDRAGGILTANIDLSGTLGAPQLNGNVDLRQGELDFYRWNLALRELQLSAQLNDAAVQFKAQGNAGQGTLNAEGNLDWRNQLNGKLQLHGEKLLVADSPEYHITASPTLTFDIRNENGKGLIDVSGEVLIPSAKLQPQAIVNAVQISDDARFKDDALYARDGTWRVNSNVNVKLGDDVHFDGLGLQGQLGGEVSTRLRTGVAASGRGELGISDGHYEAYGRKFDIKRGRLLFDNIALGNPGLDIQAERIINDVTLGDITVGVNVRGFLRDPRLEFYSDPSMSQTQIVSYLVIGKPFDQAQGQETTTVRSATSSLALQGGGYLAGQLGRRIGFEQVGVETDANNQSALVLGKFLSPRLYVSYGISLTQAINTLKLRYSVSKHWAIKTESGEAKSADVEFRIEH